MADIRVAESSDRSALYDLMKKAGIADPPLETGEMIVVENDDKRLIAGIGIETFEKFGLLRSFVILASDWDEEKTVAFFKTVFAFAQQKQIEQLYLFTKSYSHLLACLGFEETAREQVPAVIQETEQFKTHAHAVIMSCSLTR